MDQKQYYVYILTNKTHSVLYVGVTNNLVRRVFEHQQHSDDSFTSRYNVSKLVYFEVTENVESAIAREKQLKGGSRQRKLDLIRQSNPNWSDLYQEIAASA